MSSSNNTISYSSKFGVVVGRPLVGGQYSLTFLGDVNRSEPLPCDASVELLAFRVAVDCEFGRMLGVGGRRRRRPRRCRRQQQLIGANRLYEDGPIGANCVSLASAPIPGELHAIPDVMFKAVAEVDPSLSDAESERDEVRCVCVF